MNPAAEPYGLVLVGQPTQEFLIGLGTVPSLFRITEQHPTAPFASWIGPGGNWAATASTELDNGASAVLVESPSVMTDNDAELLAGRPVILMVGSSHAPQLRAFREAAAVLAGGLDLVEVLIVDGSPRVIDPRDALWVASCLLVAAGLAIDAVPRVIHREGLMIADTTIGSARTHVTHIHHSGLESRISVKAFGPGGSIETHLGDSVIAASGEVLCIGFEGATISASSFQTPVRSVLLNLHDHLKDSSASIHGRTDDYASTAHLLSKVVWGEVQSKNHHNQKEGKQ